MNKKKKLIMIGLILFSISIITLETYALYNTVLITGDASISSGEVKMSYSESNEITLNNVVPTSDKKGKSSTNYFEFSVSTYIKTNNEMSMNYNIVIEPIDIDSSYTKFSDSDIKVYLTKVENNFETVVVEPTTIDRLLEYKVSSQEETFVKDDSTHTTTYRLRTWLDYNFDASKLNEKTYSYKFRVNVNNETTLDKSGANPPELLSNMIPVYYDEENDVWKKADSNNLDKNNQWYDYDDKMWANAVTVTSTNRTSYLNASVGTEISMDDINTMWVWIPRYTYTYLNTNTPQEINIKFESGTNSSGTITCTDAVLGSGTTSQTCTDTTNGSLTAGTSTYTHPAFTFGDEELTGIWVGKFENSATTIPTSASTVDSTIIIKPNVTSLRYKAVSYLFKDVRQMEAANNAYGFEQSSSTTFNWNGNLTGDTNNIDTHMMKNMEWGAVTYLSHSKYGINKEITFNNCNLYITGIGADSVSDGTSSATCTTNKNKYNGEYGLRASTTGNIYGIYDMAGGAWEYTMSNMVDSSNQFYASSAANWSTTIYPLTKYYDSYTYDTSTTTYTRGKLGDATIEMAPTGTNGNWYSDYAVFTASTSSWFRRGGRDDDETGSGIFYFKNVVGNATGVSTARAVMSIE